MQTGALAKIALFCKCVQCAVASPTVPKGRSALAKQNLHSSGHFSVKGKSILSRYDFRIFISGLIQHKLKLN